MLAPQIFALMLLVGPAPGASPYSVVPTTTSARPCADARPLCRRPWYSAWHKSLVRQENRSEALARYFTIARSIARVADDDEVLARYLLSITLHESMWRRDIHSGVGPLALGDGGRSWSIVQARLGRYSRAGYRLIGIGSSSTMRALRWARGHLSRCSSSSHPAEVFRCYGGVSNGAREKAIAARVKSFRRFAAAPPLLSAADCAELGIEPLQANGGDEVRLCEQ